MKLTKPANCTCKYPDVIARNGSGHTNDCPAYIPMGHARLKNKIDELPDAAEARQAYEAGQNEHAQAEINRVITLILETQAAGEKTSIEGKGVLSKGTQNALRAKGYKVDQGSQYNESYWSVSW